MFLLKELVRERFCVEQYLQQNCNNEAVNDNAILSELLKRLSVFLCDSGKANIKYTKYTATFNNVIIF